MASLERRTSSARPEQRHLWLQYWLPAFGWLAIVAVFSTRALSAVNTGSLLLHIVHGLRIQMSAADFMELHFAIRKCAHFTAYALLGALFFRAFRGADAAQKIWKARYALLALAVCLLTSSSDEVHQRFTPGRTGNWHDVVLDMLGATFIQCAILFGSYTGWAARRWAGRVNAGNTSSSNPAIAASPAER